MAVVPRLSAIADLEGSALRAHEAVSNGPRLSILRLLLRRGPLTRPQVTKETGLAVSTTLSAMRELEELGYVVANVEGDRVGKRATYAANRSKLTGDLFDFMGWMLG